ncbi:MAG: bacteriohemerythrin [Gammaproteobacteria bacterium]|nr:bacteriohemerythrin [Gammaproteobacteria bacterium]MCW8911585.1 bacteriohemerythrin [Gammaproteobacteria bacterium]MCW9005287.1 bacteriohemerythrin [Gammaproteobacteria bacterium]MCW9056917.1 bacteriohemerythrin [Gammaproteobacteria bacterium]
MAFMLWSNDLVTGIQSIDEQHQWLVNTTNQLHDEINNPQPDNRKIGSILESLIEYTFNHFIVEEDMFQRFEYPQSKSHIEEHNKFAATAALLLSKYESGESVNNEALDFLKEWLKHHIMKVDMAYVPFLKEKGIN